MPKTLKTDPSSYKSGDSEGKEFNLEDFKSDVTLSQRSDDESVDHVSRQVRTLYQGAEVTDDKDPENKNHNF